MSASEQTDKIVSKQQNELFESQFQQDTTGRKDFDIFNSCSTPPNHQTLATPSDNNDDEKDSSAERNVRLRADRVPENSEKRTLLEGHVTMTTDTSLLHADELASDNQKQTVTASGNVSVETKDSLIRAKNFEGDQESGTSKLTDVQFHFFANNANGVAKSISFDEDNVATLNELTFSTCPADDESWRFSADELQLDQESGWGEAWGMWLKLKGIPVFYFPYLNFPIDDQRKSGLLPSTPSRDSRNGFDLPLLVYWNIAEQADATFRPRFIQNRGNQLGAEFRFLSQSSYNEIAFEFLGNDRIATQRLLEEPSLADGLYGIVEDRWAVSFSNKTHFSDNWTASFNAAKVSDRDYFRDLDVGLVRRQGSSARSQLLSSGDISYQDDIWRVALLAESTQSLIGNEPYRIVPSLISNADYYHLASGVRWQFESNFSRFTHSEQSQVQATRLNIMPSLSYPLQTSYAWLTPKVSYQMTNYRQDILQSNQTVSIDRNLPIFSLDSGMFFDRTIQWNKRSITHSLEPRIFYAYIPDREQQNINLFDSRLPDFSFSQLWRANRFSGQDRVGDTNHVAFSLTNRYMDDTTGEQLLSFSLGKKFYFDDRNVSLNQFNNANNDNSSSWLSEVTYRPSPRLELSGFLEWNDNSTRQNLHSGTNLARSRIKFEPRPDHIVNLSHRVRNKDGFSNEEVDLSFAWPINDEWRLVGRWYNDLQEKRTSEALFGFEYESCCWAVSIVSRRYLDVRLDAAGNQVAGLGDDFNSGVHLHFVFKGLGTPGQNSVSKLLEDSIRGYQSRF